jgi:hypothetical protein|tara:strand:- start:20957 stop:21094 length:138 start_codon:yes stop_codon:yes gene_type:complete
MCPNFQQFEWRGEQKKRAPKTYQWQEHLLLHPPSDAPEILKPRHW